MSKLICQGTNTYLIGKGANRMLIDTGEGKPSWLRHLSSVLASENASISQALLTHWHPDHVGGIRDLRSLCPEVSVYKCDVVNLPESSAVNPINDRQTFAVDGATLQAYHCPGHTTDHMSFILHEENAMFTGDNVLGHGTAVFEDLVTYLGSLDSMRRQFKGRAYPGHGAVIDDGPAKICEYISHRQQREREILHALSGVDGEAAVMELVKVVYKDVPENLHEPAAGGVLQVLQKLQADGKVRSRGSERWQLAKKIS